MSSLIFLLSLASLALAQSNATCGNILSCHLPSSSPVDTCCTESPGGLVLLTQFWDNKGPADSWTIHGLWPDNCDGTFESSCDPARAYPDPERILADAGKTALLSYMRTHWKGLGTDEQLWQHEWAKHGTCLSTLRPDCYANYHHGDEAAEYFEQTVALHKALNTHVVCTPCPTPLLHSRNIADIQSSS
jgi:ribonuclease T2